MKHNIVFKFLAIILCAASLLGMVCSAGAVVVLTEMGLYDRTVEQVRQEQVQNISLSLAQSVAQEYSAKELGGCPTALLEAQYGDYGYPSWSLAGSSLNRQHAGYALLDAEGNVLASEGSLTAENSTNKITVPVTGKYLHMVSTSPKDALIPNMDTGTENSKINEISSNGTTVSGAIFQGENNNTLYYTFSADGIGMAFYNEDGRICYRSYYPEGWDQTARVYSVVLQSSDGSALYERHDPQGVGELTHDENGYLVFRADLEDNAAEMDPAETVPETVPVTEPVTAQAVTEATLAAEETLAPTAEQGEPASAEGEPVPAEGEPVPDEGEPVPAEGEPVPAEGAPAEGEPAANEGEPAPAEGEPAPAQADGEATQGKPAQTEPVAGETQPVETAAPTVPQTVPATAAPTVPETVPETVPPTTAATLPPVTEPVMINGKPLDEYQINRIEYYEEDTGVKMVAKCVYLPMPEMTVEIYTQRGALYNDYVYDLLEIVRLFRNDLFLILAVCVLVFAITAVYLCCAGGRRPKCTDVCPGGMNRMPLDLYLALVGGGSVLGVAFTLELVLEDLLEQSLETGCMVLAAVGYGVSLLIVGFLFAAVTQFKTPGGFWWRNSLIGRILKLCWRILVWFKRFAMDKLLPFLGKIGKKAWLWLTLGAVGLGHLIGKFWRRLVNGVNRLLRMLPMLWQWLAVGGVLSLLLVLALATRSVLLMLVALFLFVAAVLYGAHCFGVLMDRTKRMAKGDLNARAEDKWLLGSFQEFGEDLNALGGVAAVAAQKQLKSERMKTELITNVSHDIKTPLTSIINYVDLLQKPHTEEEGQQYLEVLDRQSQRLKKLIEDLMDMSKASTGNMAVELRQLDAVEAVNQALGEFADKLAKAQLTPMFRHEVDNMPVMADGRLLWRVLSNLLSNAVKYAMPGTRLYIDLMELEGKVMISIKNISRDELNVDAEELMERFVRGDDSRNTEGSGLGLNIAKSLMELQKGQMQLLVDGDLFKVTLIFAGV